LRLVRVGALANILETKKTKEKTTTPEGSFWLLKTDFLNPNN
jgi:hypothetical protein